MKEHRNMNDCVKCHEYKKNEELTKKIEALEREHELVFSLINTRYQQLLARVETLEVTKLNKPW